MAKRKSKGRVKRAFASFLGFVMVVGITIAGTLAFMNAVTEEKTNTFTSTNDISLYLDEPNYNLKYTYDNAGNITASATKFPDQLDPRQYIPGETYPKDPTLYNSTGLQYLKSDSTQTELSEEWVAMRVDYSVMNPENNAVIPVTYAQLTGNVPVPDGNGGSSGPNNPYKFTDDGTDMYGLIEELQFDVETYETQNDATTVKDAGNWIRVTSDMCSNEVSELVTNKNYEIYVYKYKLKARNENSTNYNDDYYEQLASGTDGDYSDFKEYQDGREASTNDEPTERTSPLFSELTLKTQEQLQANGYAISTLPTFNIELKGGAIKDMVTITTNEIINPLTVTVSDGDSNLSNDQKTELAKKKGSQKVIDSLVKLLADQT